MKPWVTAPTGMTLAATVKRFDGAYAGYRYNVDDEEWQTGSVYADCRIALVEGTSEYAGYYEAADDIDQATFGDPGRVRFFIHNESASNRVEATIDVTISAGEIVADTDLLSLALMDGTTLGKAIQGMLDKLCGTSTVSGFGVQYNSPGDGGAGFSETLGSSVAGQRTATTLRSS